MGRSQLDNNENRSYLSEGNEEEAGMLIPALLNFSLSFFTFLFSFYCEVI